MMNTLEKLQRTRTRYFYIDPRKCTACWICVNSCKKQVIGKVGFLWHKHIAINNSANCTGCKKCIEVCPHGVFTEI